MYALADREVMDVKKRRWKLGNRPLRPPAHWYSISACSLSLSLSLCPVSDTSFLTTPFELSVTYINSSKVWGSARLH